MKNTESLKKNTDFKRVYSEGDIKANKYLIMYKIGNDLTINRLGISVSKKVGNSVVRHHMTRLVRESYRLHEKIFNSGLDIVVVVKPCAKDCTYFEIESALLHLAKLHKLYK
ncbi:MAG: ribonuclease P protein component [Lachnospiraceae bacterium]|nr:ribonuclease P protein component [Lachnospiraceae bacterium]